MLASSGLERYSFGYGVFFKDYSDVEDYFTSPYKTEAWKNVWRRIGKEWGLGTWGVLAAHLEVWEDVAECGEATIVLEDDVVFNQDFAEFDITEYLEYDWAALHKRKTYGFYAYILTPKGAKTLMENLPNTLTSNDMGTLDCRVCQGRVKGLSIFTPGNSIFEHLGKVNDENNSLRLQIDNN